MRDQKRTAQLRAKDLRGSSTAFEEILWEHVRDRRLCGLKFRRQVPIGPYIADFFCHELRLVLELDGSIHEEVAQTAHDRNRDANLSALGYRVLRVTNREIQYDLEAVLERIKHLYLHRSLPSLPADGGEAGREGPGE
jgi:very-short-patch-repair endonuclease